MTPTLATTVEPLDGNWKVEDTRSAETGAPTVVAYPGATARNMTATTVNRPTPASFVVRLTVPPSLDSPTTRLNRRRSVHPPDRPVERRHRADGSVRCRAARTWDKSL